jgi:hypothetical protein
MRRMNKNLQLRINKLIQIKTRRTFLLGLVKAQAVGKVILLFLIGQKLLLRFHNSGAFCSIFLKKRSRGHSLRSKHLRKLSPKPQ